MKNPLPIFALILALILSVRAELPADSPAVIKLAALKTAYDSAYQKDIGNAHTAAVNDLDIKYTSALDRALTTAAQSGKLDEAIALRDEKKLITDHKALPTDPAEDPDILKPLRATYRAALAKLEATRDQNTAPLRTKYDQALASLQSELTKAGDLDGALAVKNARDMPASAVANAPSSKPAEKTAKAETAAASSSEKAARVAIIAWVEENAANGIFCRVRDLKTNAVIAIKKTEELPKNDFWIEEITRELHTQEPITPIPWKHLEAMSALRVLCIPRQPALTREQMKIVANLPKLAVLELHLMPLVPEITQSWPAMPDFLGSIVLNGDSTTVKAADLGIIAAKWPQASSIELSGKGVACAADDIRQIKSMKRLHHISISADSFTPGGVAAFGQLPGLQSVAFWGAAEIDPDELKSLKNCKKIDFWYPKKSITFLTALPSMPWLNDISIKAIGMQDADMVHLTQMTKLQRLSIDNDTKLSDAALAALKPMKALVGFYLARMPNITADAIAAFKKDHPKCKVFTK